MSTTTRSSGTAISQPRRRRSLLDRIRHGAAIYRQRRILKNMDDARLNDIGITRREADIEVARPVWDVPSFWQR